MIKVTKTEYGTVYATTGVTGGGGTHTTNPIQKKEWVGLTDDDVDYFVDAIYKGFDMKPRNEVEIAYFERLIKFVGAKLKEKNT